MSHVIIAGESSGNLVYKMGLEDTSSTGIYSVPTTKSHKVFRHKDQGHLAQIRGVVVRRRTGDGETGA